MGIYPRRYFSDHRVTCRTREFDYTRATYKSVMPPFLKRLLAAQALPLALCFATLAFAEGSHTAWVRAAMESLPTYVEDRGNPDKTAQLDAIAAAIAEASKDAPRPPREWAALLLTIGHHESGFSLRIQRGECKPFECDHGRARSAWQLHKNLYTAPVWDQLHGIENTTIQVKTASEALKRAYFTCSGSGEPWLVATLNGYAGRRCGGDWPGLHLRMATFKRLLSTTAPRKRAQTSRLDVTHGGVVLQLRGVTAQPSGVAKLPIGARVELSRAESGSRLAGAAQAFEHSGLAQLFAEQRELALRSSVPAQRVDVFRERYVAAQRRELSIQ